MARDCRYFLGLDLGQSQDPTALAILERPLVYADDPISQRRPAHAVRHLERYPLGTSYPAVIQSVVRTWSTPTLAGSVLVVDETGVGRAVVDHLREGVRGKVTGRLMPIAITGGRASTVAENGSLHLPKKELVGVLQVLLQTRRLRIPQALPDADVLLRELQAFKVKITAARHETFEAWREGDHDDLVLAVALAAWLAEKTLPSLAVHHTEPPPPTVLQIR